MTSTISPPSSLSKLITPRLNRYIGFELTAKQSVSLLLPQKETLFGGQVGGGKSVGLLAAALQYFDVPGYSALILRTTRVSLHLPGGLIPLSHQWLDGKAHWSEQKSTWTSPEGATLTFGYMDAPRDHMKFNSSQFQFIGFEELTEFRRESDYRYLASRLRAGKTGGDLDKVPFRMRSTTNPIGPGYAWVKARFIGDNDNRIKPTKKKMFLPSGLDDNPHLDTEEYHESLSMLPPIIARKLKDGDWSAVEKGEFFDRAKFKVGSPPGDMVKIVRFWDNAYTKPNPQNLDPDWTCGVKLGLDRRGYYWILGVEMFRLNPTEAEGRILQTILRDGKSIFHAMFQDPGAGKSVIEKWIQKLGRGYQFEGWRVSGSKIVEAAGISSKAGAHRVRVSPTIGDAFGEFMDQLEGFPLSGHDDAVDALSGAFNYLLTKKGKRKHSIIGKRVH